MKMNNYRVTFTTKKNGVKHWSIDVSTRTESDARKMATELWFWETINWDGNYYIHDMEALPLDGKPERKHFVRVQPKSPSGDRGEDGNLPPDDGKPLKKGR